MKKHILIFILIIVTVVTFSQNKFDNYSRARYIFDIAKQVTWPNESTIDTFRIFLLTSDTALNRIMKTTASNLGLLHKKPIMIYGSSKYDDITSCEIIFFKNDEDYDIDKVKKKITCTTLMITENFEFHKSMINFIVINNIRRYELNMSKLTECGYKLTELFIEGSVKSKADWEQLYKKTDLALQKEKEIVEQQNQLLAKQRAEIEQQQQIITKQQREIEEQIKEIEKQKLLLTNILNQVRYNKILLVEKMKELEQREKVLQAKNAEINEKSVILSNQKEEIEKQNERIAEQKKILNKQLEQIHMQQLILYMFIGLVILLIILGFFIYRNYQIKKHANIILSQKNAEILRQNDEIKAQKEKIELQRDEIALQKQEIMDSIRYASRIQQAVLPPIRVVEEILRENFFIFNRPRDIVSGDYYFITSRKNKLIVSAADCTGHGVPGAFMSLLGISFLNEIINRIDALDAAVILNHLRENIINALNQGSSAHQTKDGMDMVLCLFDFENKTVEFAGANNPLYHVRNKELTEYKGDKMPIGVYDDLKPFTKHSISFETGDVFYMFSDGYADQFGGPEGKKFKYKALKELLISISHLPMNEQYKIVEKTHEQWKGDYFQVDDILLIGIRCV
ncbi:MAG: YfiR/HmsC family protein [Bacteroidales bacterium]|nr:YfiR/HmsC family protein [Bacteroidales bacterium]